MNSAKRLSQIVPTFLGPLAARLPWHLMARAFDAETAHGLAVGALRLMTDANAPIHDPRLAVRLAGLHFPSPIGLAAGFDKNAEVPGAALALGFGFAEVGTLTPLAQPGNPKPRIFREAGHHALINRLGFNNDGFAPAKARLEGMRRSGIVGVNVGANKESADRIQDYVSGIECFFAVADYFTVNISSPNTPGLRDLQEAEALKTLLGRIMDKHAALMPTTRKAPPVFVKIAPDMTDATLDALCRTVLASGVHGMIVSNTTISRPALAGARHLTETGGLSGQPLYALSTRALARARQSVGRDFPLIAAGGVDSAEAALEKIAAGADLVQLYTALAYHGFGLPARINKGLLRLIGPDSLDAIRGRTTDAWARVG
jgi:dihydroorotate dehydrogenase